MVLEMRVIDIPLFGGVDTKTDSKSVDPNKSTLLENAIQEKTGEIQKRNGYTAVGIGTTSNVNSTADDEMKSANSIHDYSDELIMVGADGNTAGETTKFGPHIFSKSKSLNKWSTSGDHFPCTFDTRTISKADESMAQVSLADGGDMRAYVYQYTNATPTLSSYIDIVDKETGTVLRERLAFATTAKNPKVEYITDGYGSAFVALAISDQSAQAARKIFGTYISSTNPGDLGTVISSVEGTQGDIGDIHSDKLWDMTKIEYPAHTAGRDVGGQGGEGVALDAYSEAIIAFKRAGGQIAVMALNGHADPHRSIILPVTPINTISLQYIQDPDTNEERIFVLYQDATTGDIMGYGLRPDLTISAGPTIIDSQFANSDPLQNITVASETSNGTSQIRVFAELPFNRDQYRRIYTTTASWAMAGGTQAILYHEGLASKAWTYKKQAFVMTIQQTSLQSTYFVRALRGATPIVVAKAFYGDAGKLRLRSSLSAVVSPYAGLFSVGCLRQARVISNSERNYQVAEINFNMNPSALQSVQLGSTLVIGGGQVMGYDRKSQELGFHLHPENLKDDSSVATGGAMGDGYRSFRAVYSWTDRNGDVYRSAPSEAIGFEYVTGVGNDTIKQSLKIAYLAHTDITNKVNGDGQARVDIYRTVAGGSIFYLVRADVNYNSGVLDELQTLEPGHESDESISANEILYTAGGVLSNIGPPASNILAVSKNRVFLVPMDDPETVWFSKEKVTGVGIEFAEELQIRVERGGKNTGLATIDDKLVIFKEREIYVVAGEGPNDKNQGGFSPVRQISSDVGCVDPASVINVGQGIMFKSTKGIYLLNRSMQAVYIGAPVEKWNDYSIISANLIEDKNQVRFILSLGQGALVYDYYHNQWARFLNHSAQDATVYNGVYHWLKEDGIVRQEDEGFSDINFVIPMKVRTGWIKLSGLQGYQRARSAAVIGQYRSPHSLVVKVYYDYDALNAGQTNTFTSHSTMSGNEPLQYELHLKKQKCQAIMFEIYDESQQVTLESFTLTGISVEVGVKKGPVKLPTRKRQ